jgi:hypothetical protein
VPHAPALPENEKFTVSALVVEPVRDTLKTPSVTPPAPLLSSASDTLSMVMTGLLFGELFALPEAGRLGNPGALKPLVTTTMIL